MSDEYRVILQTWSSHENTSNYDRGRREEVVTVKCKSLAEAKIARIVLLEADLPRKAVRVYSKSLQGDWLSVPEELM